jgi:Ni/Fe-hydrogenase subunit HybB-like protein
MSHHKAVPVGGAINTKPFRWLTFFFLVGMVMVAWRLIAGLGATTAMNDGYPWGIWITYDVVTGTAFACGGYAVALLLYILNKGKYHPLIRSAILTSALGYTLAGIHVVLDVGRYWLLWKVIVLPHWWNGNSILLEVALCIAAYVIVLWIELSPAFLERWRESGPTGLQKFSEKLLPFLNKALIWIIALGVLLPSMHQSSLGSVMILSGFKLDPLWHTGWLPFLFLVSCIAMGYAAVVFESTLSNTLLKRPRETKMLGQLAVGIIITMIVFLAVRFIDLGVRGQFGRFFTAGWNSVFFIIEMLLFIFALLMLFSKATRTNTGKLFLAAMAMMLGGALYRFNVYLIGYNPGPGWSYFPAVPEFLVTFGFVALEIMVYIAVVKRFPILVGVPPSPARKRTRKAVLATEGSSA